MFFASAPSALIVALVSGPAMRGRVHRWLGELGKSGSKEQEAAAIASLLGGRRGCAAAALAQARRCFRALPVASLTVDELSDNQPNPALADKSEEALLGEVAAFMSHSWSDDGVRKHERLREYASEHQSRVGTPCRIWLDKARAAHHARTPLHAHHCHAHHCHAHHCHAHAHAHAHAQPHARSTHIHTRPPSY